MVNVSLQLNRHFYNVRNYHFLLDHDFFGDRFSLEVTLNWNLD